LLKYSYLVVENRHLFGVVFSTPYVHGGRHEWLQRWPPSYRSSSLRVHWSPLGNLASMLTKDVAYLSTLLYAEQVSACRVECRIIDSSYITWLYTLYCRLQTRKMAIVSHSTQILTQATEVHPSTVTMT
jgi:hypothetical protein